MGTLVNSLWDRCVMGLLRLGYEHGAKAPLTPSASAAAFGHTHASMGATLVLHAIEHAALWGCFAMSNDVSAYCLLSSKFSQPLNPINYSAYRTFFVFVPAGFTVVASKINDLQMTLFPFAFGKSFF